MQEYVTLEEEKNTQRHLPASTTIQTREKEEEENPGCERRRSRTKKKDVEREEIITWIR
jgi:hypothetical protein